MSLSAKLVIALFLSFVAFAICCGSGDDNGTFSPPDAGHEGSASEGGGGAEGGSDAGSDAGIEAGPETGSSDGGGAG